MTAEQDVFDDDVRLLLTMPKPAPSRVDIGLAVAAGRRKVRRRRRGMAGAVAAALVVLAGVPLAVGAMHGQHPTPVAAPTAGATSPAAADDASVVAKLAGCRPGALAMPPGLSNVKANAMDPTGRFVAGISYEQAKDGSGALRSILWTDGHPQLIPVSGTDASAVAVNSSGAVVGLGTRTAEATQFAWLYRDGAVTDLPAPPGYTSAFAQAINTAGVVVGQAQNVKNQSTVAVLWPIAGPPRVLAAPPDAQATGIADDGTVVGSLSGKDIGWVWDPDGHGHALSTPAGLHGGGALAIRGDWVVGFGTLPDPSPHTTAAGTQAPPKSPLGKGPDALPPVLNAVRWNLRTGAVTTVPGIGALGGVNARGDGVLAKSTQPVLTVGSTVVTLRPLTTAVRDYFVRAIDDADSTVVGYMTTGPREAPDSAPVIWHC